MLKVYFDNNVYSDICKGIDREFIEVVYELAESQVLFLYSQAHLNDLSADKTDHKYEELRIIEEIAEDNFLHQDPESNQITNSLIKAKEAFELYGDIQNDVGVFLEGSFDKTGDPLVDTYIDLVKMQPIDLGEEVERILAKDDKDPAKAMYARLGITKRYYTLGEWLPITAKMMSSFENEPDLIKSIRLQSKQHLQVDKFNIKIDDIKFDEKLSKSKIGKSFKEMLDQQMSFNPDNQQDFYYEFITGFNMINFLGLDYEKNRKVRFKSTQNDGQHSYYGAVSDIIVSRDDGLLNKSRFMYRYYGIDTKVMSINGFKEFIKTYKDVSFSNELLFIADLRFKMDRSIVVAEKRPIIRHNQNEEVRKLITPYWGLFNRISRVKSNDNDKEEYVVLYANRVRSGNITFYKEVNYIISHLNEMLKLEHDYLSDEDKDLINKGKWEGRFWKSANTAYWLRYNNETKRIGLQIVPIE